MNEDQRDTSMLRYWCGTQPEWMLTAEEYREVVRTVAELKREGGAA